MDLKWRYVADHLLFLKPFHLIPMSKTFAVWDLQRYQNTLHCITIRAKAVCKISTPGYSDRCRTIIKLCNCTQWILETYKNHTEISRVFLAATTRTRTPVLFTISLPWPPEYLSLQHHHTRVQGVMATIEASWIKISFWKYNFLTMFSLNVNLVKTRETIKFVFWADLELFTYPRMRQTSQLVS